MFDRIVTGKLLTVVQNLVVNEIALETRYQGEDLGD